MSDTFTLQAGKWKITYRDGRTTEVVSDGTMSVDMREVVYVVQVFP